MDPSKLWITIYLDDDEAFEIWNKHIGISADRIVRKGKEDNFWEIGVGPCGPCSEIHIDRGPSFGCGRPECDINCGCDRFLEIWNLVFIQFFKDAEGKYTPLESKSIDTGMGLERTAAFLQDVPSVFDTDEMMMIRDTVTGLSGRKYGADVSADVGIRVITDHSRAATFMVSDGILPTNEGRGYVLRRLVRRAIRYGRLLGIQGQFMGRMVEAVINTMKGTYPELVRDSERILRVITLEEQRFMVALEQGSALLSELMAKADTTGPKEISGKDAFLLYDTFGFPYELTVEMASEQGFKVDRKGFEEAMAAQRQRARSARGANVYMDEASAKYKALSSNPTEFTGYSGIIGEAKLIGVLTGEGEAEGVGAGENAELVFESSPFYAEGGGQVFDTGEIFQDGKLVAKITSVQKPLGDTFFHKAEVLAPMELGTTYALKVDGARRDAIRRNHSATHLLHEALRQVLGEHVQQSGSYVTDERLRFDYSHFQPLKKEEIRKVEALVNGWVLSNLQVSTEVLGIEDAKKSGATALFDEKYGQKVRVVSMGDVSKELCGGTHVGRTGDIGPFKLLTDSGIASGVRRVECLTGINSLEYLSEAEATLDAAADALKSDRDGILAKIEKLQSAIKESERALAKVKQQQALSNLDLLLADAAVYGVSKIVAARFDGMGPNELRELADKLRAKLQSGVILLGSVSDEKPAFIAAVTPDLVKAGLNAGELAKEMARVAGGGGGGKADMAQAGGKDPGKTDEALEAGRLLAGSKLG